MNEVTRTRLLGRVSVPMQSSATTAVLMAVVLVGVLYFARDVLVPIVLAVLMSFVLGCPRSAAVCQDL